MKRCCTIDISGAVYFKNLLYFIVTEHKPEPEQAIFDSLWVMLSFSHMLFVDCIQRTVYDMDVGFLTGKAVMFKVQELIHKL